MLGFLGESNGLTVVCSRCDAIGIPNEHGYAPTKFGCMFTSHPDCKPLSQRFGSGGDSVTSCVRCGLHIPHRQGAFAKESLQQLLEHGCPGCGAGAPPVIFVPLKRAAGELGIAEPKTALRRAQRIDAAKKDGGRWFINVAQFRRMAA